MLESDYKKKIRNCKSAFREAVWMDMYRIKRSLYSSSPKSGKSGERLNWEDTHLDHKYRFSEMLYVYMKERGLKWSDIQISWVYNKNLKRKSPEILLGRLKADWRKWHLEKGKFRLLSASENLSRKRFCKSFKETELLEYKRNDSLKYDTNKNEVGIYKDSQRIHEKLEGRKEVHPLDEEVGIYKDWKDLQRKLKREENMLKTHKIVVILIKLYIMLYNFNTFQKYGYASVRSKVYALDF